MSTATREKPTPGKAFDILCDQLKKKPASQKLIMAHLRAVTGTAAPLPVYHNTFCSECKQPEHCDKCADERVEMYRLMVKAIMSNNFTILQGQVGAGDKRSDPVHTAEKKKAATQATTPEPPPEPTKGPEVAPVQREVKSAPPIGVEESIRELIRDEIGNAHEATIKRIVEAQIQPLTEAVRSLESTITELVNAETAKSIAEDAIKHAMSNGGFPEDRVRGVVREMIKTAFTQ